MRSRTSRLGATLALIALLGCGADVPGTSQAADATADTEVPDASQAADAAADTEVPDAWQPVDAAADAEVPDTSQPADATANEEVPDTSQPADAAANDEVPDTSQPADAAATDVAAADAAAPDTAAPDAAPPTCPMPKTAGHHKPSCQGVVFDLHIPTACPGGGCGLIVDVHGLTMSAAMQDANTAMRKLGEQHGYVVIQPNANPAPPAASWQPGADDAKILTFVEDAIAQLAIDGKRVHFMGFSQGGWMSWRMVCKRPDLFASVAPGAGCSFMGTEGCSFSGGQVPKAELPVLYLHGKKDVLQPWSCASQQIAAIEKGWALQQVAVVSQDGGHLWRRYASAKGTTVEVIEHDYKASSPLLGGHCYPGSADLKGGAPGQLFAFGCEGQAAFSWGQAAMAFFLQHPKP